VPKELVRQPLRGKTAKWAWLVAAKFGWRRVDFAASGAAVELSPIQQQRSTAPHFGGGERTICLIVVLRSP
jgi:hypothetical protein